MRQFAGGGREREREIALYCPRNNKTAISGDRENQRAPVALYLDSFRL